MNIDLAREPATERTDEDLYRICTYGQGVARMFARLADAAGDGDLVEISRMWPYTWSALDDLARAVGVPTPQASGRFEVMRRAWFDLARVVPPVAQLDWYGDADAALCRCEAWVHVHGDPACWAHRVESLAADLDGLGSSSGWYEVADVASDVAGFARFLGVAPSASSADPLGLVRWSVWADLYEALPEALADRLNLAVAMLRLRVEPESFDPFV